MRKKCFGLKTVYSVKTKTTKISILKLQIGSNDYLTAHLANILQELQENIMYSTIKNLLKMYPK